MAVQLPDALTSAPLPSLVGGRRLRAQALAGQLKVWVPAGVLILLLAMCFLLPLVVRLPPAVNGSILDADEPPFSPGHWLGTDAVGNDIFSRICYGGRIAFEVPAAVTAIGIVGGCLLGITAGYLGGWVDAILSRIIDVLIAVPAIVLALAIAEGLQPSEFHLILALSVFSVPAYGRVSRGATIAVRELPFMLASRLSGTRSWRSMVRHVLPNIWPGLVTFGLLGFGVVVILEGILDFLGYGIQPPTPSWGAMIQAGQTVMDAQPEYVLIPSLFLLVTVLALNTLGDALRERWGVR